ncbi:TPA: recombinase family protein, partial [Klebsiella pneumoniae]
LEYYMRLQQWATENIKKLLYLAGDDAVINYGKMRLEFLQKALAQDTSGDFCFRVLHPEVSGLRVLTGKGAQIDTTTASGRMVFGIFATLAEFERDLIRERTMAGLASARARGRKGGRKFALTKAQVRLAQAAMAQRDTSVSDLCKELGIERVTLYRYVGPKGELRDHGKHVLGLT